MVANFYLILLSLLLERMGFYSFLALYGLYRKSMGDSKEQSSMAVASVLIAVYALTFLGGWNGRRFGFKISGAVGLLGLACAYAMVGLATPPIFWMPILALSIGLFKPAPVIVLGRLTAHLETEAQDKAMAFLYVAVNVGGCVGPLVGGLLLGHWTAAFLFSAACSFAALCLWLAAPETSSSEMAVAMALSPGASATRFSSSSRWAWAVAGMSLIAMIFYAGYNAFFGPVEHWIEDGVDRQVGGFSIPTPWFNAENGLLIVVAGLLWPGMMAGWRVSSRFSLALAASMASYLVLISWSGKEMTLAPAWVAFGVVFLQTFAEICLSPLGLSRVQSLSPSGAAWWTTALWYLSNSAGSGLSGYLSFSGMVWLLGGGLLLTLAMRRYKILDYDPKTDTETSVDGNKILARSPG